MPWYPGGIALPCTLLFPPLPGPQSRSSFLYDLEGLGGTSGGLFKPVLRQNCHKSGKTVKTVVSAQNLLKLDQ